MIALAVTLLSAAILAYEVALIRLLSIVQWHHVTTMVISIALLGFGASGTFLSLARATMERRFHAVFAVGAALFAVTSFAGLLLAQRVPFNALALIWEPRQLLHLLSLYALFTAPFFFGATCIGLVFIRYGESIGSLYRYNLIGSGIGGLAVLGGLFLIPPEAILKWVSALALAAAAVCLLAPSDDGKRRRLQALPLVLAAAVLPLMPNSWIALQFSAYKPLSRALEVPGARLIETRSNPLAQLSVVESGAIPFRHAPGLSLNNTTTPPAQIGVFSDGGAFDVVTAFNGRLEPLEYMGFSTSALPYHLLERPSVLILGAGGGSDVLRAVYHGARRIDGVEANPDMADLVRVRFREFAGGLYERPDVRLHVTDARAFVQRSRGSWDLIEIPLYDVAGSLGESYVYTEEAFRAYLQRLAPGGILAITRWMRLPPRDSAKLLATALHVLKRDGIGSPAGHLALIRGWKTTTLLIKKEALSNTDKAAVRRFAAERSFDVAYLADLEPEEVNRFNLLERPIFNETALALIGPNARAFMSGYKFDIRPATDDRPYFFDFFKWRALPEFLGRQARGAGFLEWGYPLLAASLVQVALLSGGLILLPLWVRRQGIVDAPDKTRVFLYFTALGLAFLFLEIAFIQRFVLFLGNPLYAAAVVIAGFLIFAGLGSGCSAALSAWLERATVKGTVLRRLKAIDLAILAIAAMGLLYLIVLPPLLERLIVLPEAARFASCFALIAPLAFLMGLPFPLGLSQVSNRMPALVPWAWGINGCASVLSVILAQLLAIHFGFTTVIVLAIGFYLMAAAALRGTQQVE